MIIGMCKIKNNKKILIINMKDNRKGTKINIQQQTLLKTKIYIKKKNNYKTLIAFNYKIVPYKVLVIKSVIAIVITKFKFWTNNKTMIILKIIVEIMETTFFHKIKQLKIFFKKL